MLISGLSSVTLPFLQQKGLADEFYSLYLTFGSVGAVAGTFIPGMLPKPMRDKLCSLLPMILGTLASFITALSRNPALVCVSYLIANLLNSIGNIIVSSAMILGCEEQMRGRLVALETSIMTAGRLISTLAFGFFGESLALGLALCDRSGDLSGPLPAVCQKPSPESISEGRRQHGIRGELSKKVRSVRGQGIIEDKNKGVKHGKKSPSIKNLRSR